MDGSRDAEPVRLPVEVWSLVFSFLSNRDLLSVSLVCRNWLSLCSEPSLWRHLQYTQSGFNDRLPLLLNSKRMCEQTRSLSICLEKFLVQEFAAQTLKLIFSRAPQLRRLELRGSLQIGWNHFPPNQLQELLFQGCLLALESPNNVQSNQSASFQCSMDSFPCLATVAFIQCHNIQPEILHNLLSLPRLHSLTLRGGGARWNSQCIQAVFSRDSAADSIYQLDLSDSEIGKFADIQLKDVLIKTPALIRLTVNKCPFLKEDVFIAMVKKHGRDVCPNLEVIEARDTCLSEASLPTAWRHRGVSLILH